MMEALLLILIAVALFFALRHIKRHKPTCGGACAHCGMDCDKE